MKNFELYKDFFLEGLKDEIRFGADKIAGRPFWCKEPSSGGEQCRQCVFNDPLTSCKHERRMWLTAEHDAMYWENVPIDTLVRVKNDMEDEWTLAYFYGYSGSTEDRPYPIYITYANGATSITSQDMTKCWIFCEIVDIEKEGLVRK